MVGYSSFFERHFATIVIGSILLVLLLVVLWPVLYVFYMSLYEVEFTAPSAFVGLRNYSRLIKDAHFWEYLKNTAIYTGGSLSLAFLLSMIIALSLNRIVRFKGAFRAIILLPWAIPVAVTALLWRLLLNDQVGAVNAMLMRIGLLQRRVLWLGEPSLARLSTVVADAWTRVPFITILLLAGLQGIPQDLYDSAKVDGAGPLVRFRYVTVPLLRSTIIVILIIVGIYIFRTYTLIGVLTSGGPGDATQVFTTYIYQTGVERLDIGYSSALSVVMFSIVILISLLYRGSKL
jgi:multiple sugar transport system permease protein